MVINSEMIELRWKTFLEFAKRCLDNAILQFVAIGRIIHDSGFAKLELLSFF